MIVLPRASVVRKTNCPFSRVVPRRADGVGEREDGGMDVGPVSSELLVMEEPALVGEKVGGVGDRDDGEVVASSSLLSSVCGGVSVAGSEEEG